jgi:ferrochelatase
MPNEHNVISEGHSGKKIAVVLFNLGGPDSLHAVKPFLKNLFSDPAIIAAPAPVRKILSAVISSRRAKTAREIYRQIGGKSPILQNTIDQANDLEACLKESITPDQSDTTDVKCFVAMRYWHPFIQECASRVAGFDPDIIVLLPLYPQYSTTTTGSSAREWWQQKRRFKISAPDVLIGCYPLEEGLIQALTDSVESKIRDAGLAKSSVRILFSAHGLPKKIIESGDPYQWQVEQTALAIIKRLRNACGEDLDWSVCYQSRVGPLEWIGPSTDSEITRAGVDGRDVVLVPIAFVSEHSETLVELDVEYRALADRAGIKNYLRIPTVSTSPAFISGLARMVVAALSKTDSGQTACMSEGVTCPEQFDRCMCRSFSA